MSHPAHSHPHLHPHWIVKHHHHPHTATIHGEKKDHSRPSPLAHHHGIPRFRQPSVPTTSTRNVRRVWRTVYRWFPHAVSLGVFNCRKIAGSTSWSEHSWADAWDVASIKSAKTLQPDPYLDAIVAYLRKRLDDLSITRILYRIVNHLSHAHVDVDPDHSGETPPCA